MDLKEKTKKLSEYYNIKPARSRGQNFLIKESVFDRAVEIADIQPGDTVLEIGPGLGFLTTKLADKAKQVIAVELDDKLAEVLTAMVKNSGTKNITIKNKSTLDINIDEELPSKYKIVANLPYQITAKFLKIFLSSQNRPQSMTLMLQKEVAQRIVAKPGKMSLLALSVQFYGEPELKDIVPRHNFWPEPEVDSALIYIKTKNNKQIVAEFGINEVELDNFAKKFFKLAKIGFSNKRKMLKNNLAAYMRLDQKDIAEALEKLGYNPSVRAQELSLADWAKLLGVFG